MEIKFNEVTYKENIMTPLEMIYLKDFSCTIESNTITTFIGNSLSGINKIGDLINAVIFPTKGTVTMGTFINDGKRIRKVNRLRTNIGHVLTNPDEMLFNKTVKSELEFGLKYFKYKLNKKEIRVLDALKLVGLTEEYLNKKIIDLNLTEKRKITLASVLIFNPSVIILEEPEFGLNSKEVEELKKLIKLLKNKYNKTIIILTKDSDFAYSISERVHLVYQGELIRSGKKDILTDTSLLTTYGIKIPEIIKFIRTAKNKNINLTLTDNILDLIKEVYRNAK